MDLRFARLVALLFNRPATISSQDFAPRPVTPQQQQAPLEQAAALDSLFAVHATELEADATDEAMLAMVLGAEEYATWVEADPTDPDDPDPDDPTWVREEE